MGPEGGGTPRASIPSECRHCKASGAREGRPLSAPVAWGPSPSTSSSLVEGGAEGGAGAGARGRHRSKLLGGPTEPLGLCSCLSGSLATPLEPIFFPRERCVLFSSLPCLQLAAPLLNLELASVAAPVHGRPASLAPPRSIVPLIYRLSFL